ncbi:MAG: D-glycero-beta-D-manno-heptose 1-phosphate adenylyltransferase [bacterium]
MRRKLFSSDELRPLLAERQGRGEKIVFTNGCFDLLHIGHVRYLEAARAEGNCLIVALNGDDSIRRLKGEHRPLLQADQRSRVIGGLSSVDYVTFFDEDDPRELIKKLRPDVLVKGGDYEIGQVLGREEIWTWGGRVATIPVVPGSSTSAIVKKIVEQFGKDAK